MRSGSHLAARAVHRVAEATEGTTTAANLRGTPNDCPNDARPTARIEQRSARRLDAELSVKPLGRVRDHGKRQVDGVRPEIVHSRMEYDHLANNRSLQALVLAAERMQVERTHRTTSKASELQMNDPLRIGQLEATAVNGDEQSGRNRVARQYPL